MIFVARKTYPELMRFDLDAFIYFLFVMFMIASFRVYSVNVLGSPRLSVDMFNLPSLFLVFWEDMFFVFPSLLLYSLTKNRYIVAPVMVLSSLAFSIGHLYISTSWALVLLAYVPLMFFFARKKGMLTVMAAHVTYDVLTYLTFYFISLGVS